MKKTAAVLMVLLVMLSCMAGAVSAEQSEDHSTNVILNSPSIHDCSIPDDHEFLTWTEAAGTQIGMVKVENVFLEENETLSWELTIDDLKKANGRKMVYSLTFDPDVAFSEDGEWPVTVTITDEDWNNAYQGVYKAKLKFTLMSSTHGAVWVGYTKLTATKTTGKEGDDSIGAMVALWALNVSALIAVVMIFIIVRRRSREKKAADAE